MTTWTRLIRFTTAESSVPVYGQPVPPSGVSERDDDIGLRYHASKVSGAAPVQAHLIVGDPFGSESCIVTKSLLSVRTLLSPLPAELVGAPRCLGANYQGPAAKKGSVPILFLKPASSLSHPESTIVVPAHASDDQADYEAELVIVVGRTAKDVEPANALDYVAGYTLCNDVSARKLMAAASQWGMGKSLDGWLPFGPVIVSSKLVEDPQKITLKAVLNGKEYQNDTTAKQLWTVAETIVELSKGSTLSPGTIIATGTPAGQGSTQKPPVWLRHGDDIRISGSHGLGTLINTVVEVKKGAVRAKL
ncbi:hypothetical protein E5Q_02153 [Mixia osmundae IAM 14324]|uniref:Fumarylacetoacetase-like C-terminal domain-containing protein n=1 Tax=Mixia osmundae (strain CBS 9802 / IAM 14324 / JCM 22182 / KY 12970) TaxID=764103 RepID=G7DY38_MIXOS|nr:hypothetical protein E5Q_02153 [Mixia osmundae IAM 14324]